MNLVLVSLAYLAAIVSAQQTVGSQGKLDGNGDPLVYTCPTTQTIETAFFGYCPATNQVDDTPLNGVTTYITYNDAPSYESTVGSLELFCEYPINDPDPVCAYLAGGGESLRPSPERTNTGCRAAVAGVPQPSGGGNYRRSELSKRVLLGGRRPSFTCPFTSTDPSIYLANAQTDTGTAGVGTGNAYNFVANPTDMVYTCGYTDGVSSTSCFYVQPDGGAVRAEGAGPGGDVTICPLTVCNAIYDGTGNQMRKRAFVEGVARKLALRQVDPRKLLLDRGRVVRRRKFGHAPTRTV